MNNYGVVQTGEHVFYIKGADGKEALDEKQNISIYGSLIGGEWRIARVISYDHGPAR